MPKKPSKKIKKAKTEKEDLELALEGFREMARQAATDLAVNGLVPIGSQGRTKVNPMAKIFRDAVKTTESLHKRLRTLKKEQPDNNSDDDEFKDFKN
jgi:phage terminase small subunit